MAVEDRVLVALHRAATLAGRPGIAVPSVDLPAALGITAKSAAAALGRLVRAERAISVRKDLVVLPDSTGRVTVGMPELIKAVAPERHLITGGRALEEYNLTDQHAFTLVVLVPGQIVEFSFRGEKAIFLVTKSKRIWGWKLRGTHFARPERVLVDAVNHPRYGVSLPTAISALQQATERDPRFLHRLASSARRYDSEATSRRLGLLVDRLFGAGAAAPFEPLIGERRKPVLLRATGAAYGELDSKWRVIVNATTEPETSAA